MLIIYHLNSVRYLKQSVKAENLCHFSTLCRMLLSMCLKIVLASVPFLSLITVNRLPRHFYSKYEDFFACLKFTFLSLTVIVISKCHQYETAYFTTISKIRYDFMETFFLLNLTIFKFPAHPAIIVINKLLLWDLNLGPLSRT